MKFSDIDSNFKLNNRIPKNTIFYSPQDPPFSLHGIFMESGKYRRMPEAAAAAVSEGVYALHANTAGGRLRFRTDSPWISILAHLDQVVKMSHFALTGSTGFDLYCGTGNDCLYVGTYVPDWDIESEFTGTIDTNHSGMQEYTIHFPLYAGIKDIYIGLQQGACLEAPSPYLPVPPIVSYGSSITQGGCASRPGSCYQNILSRRFQVDHLNLGFSGNALGEQSMMHYIAGLNMSAFILDYDFNAPTPEYLQSTHEPAYQIIRSSHPDIPILLLSRPRYHLNPDDRHRLEIIKDTFNHARSAGDKKVYFLSGPELMQYCGQDGTVDGTHPTDLGFASMARTIGDTIQALGII